MPTRRLAAVLFADIVGYTAMMQQNETEGMAKAQRFREELPQLVQTHQGEVIEIKGDGALCLFNSAAEATACAQQIQVKLGDDIPLRIGIHLGDIMQHSDHIMGDAVNIASRIESMGVAGAVLLSSSIRQQIKNKPEFELVSLGKFAFKNVAEPMTVYALRNEGIVVPKAEQMKGKGDQLGWSSKRIVQLASVGFVAMALGAMVFWVGGFMGAGEDQLSAKIKEERVAIIPFNNRTTNSELNVFGDFCSDIITNGLTEAGVKTCSPRTIQQYNHLIGVLPNNPEGKASFSEVVGARYWVEGYFSQKGDTLTVNSYLTDGTNGDIVRNFPEIKGHVNNKEGLADDLTRRLMSYWVAREDIEQGKFKPPLYEAYLEYRKISQSGTGRRNNKRNDTRYGRRAFEIDSTFYAAALREMYWRAESKSPRTDTLIAVLEPHYHEMTAFEQTLFDANKAFYQSDYDTYGKMLGKNYTRFPRDPFIIQHYAFTLAFRESRPAKAWEVANQVKLEQLDISPSQRAQRIGWMAIYGLAAGQFEAVNELVEIYPRTKEWLGLYFHLKSKALVRNGKLDALEKLSKEVETAKTSSHWHESQYDLAVFCNEVAEELLLLKQEEQAQKWLNKALEWVTLEQKTPLNIRDSLHLLRTNYLLGRYQVALLWGEEACQSCLWNDNKYKATLGAAYARLGQRDNAEMMIQQFWEGGIDFKRYYAAQIYAELGEKERVMDLLYEREKLGGAKGLGYLFEYTQYDYLMRNLFDYPPFVELMGIRDEEMID